MEIRTFTIKYSKRKAKKSLDEEVSLQTRLIIIQNKLHPNYNESDKIEMDNRRSCGCACAVATTFRTREVNVYLFKAVVLPLDTSF